MTPKAAKAKATKLHAQLVRARGQCQSCGKTSDLQCAHIISRRYSATRTLLENAFCLCAGCHMRFTEWPLEFAEFVDVKIGPDAYEGLRSLALSHVKVDWFGEVERLTRLLKETEAA